jgi:hypothetical protein
MARAIGFAWRRDVIYFAAGPGLVALIACAAFALHPWPVPNPSQAAALQPVAVLALLTAGLVGAALSSAAGFPSVPTLRDGAAWRRLLLPSLGGGAVFGAVLLGVDAATQFTAGALAALHITWVNLPLPVSLLHWSGAAVLLECLYRIAPLGVLSWFIGAVLLKGRDASALFWSLAILASCIEPASLLALSRSGAGASLMTLMAIAFAANIFEAFEMRRHGWPAPVLFRLAFYAVWHTFGPYLLAPSSVLYPGLH